MKCRFSFLFAAILCLVSPALAQNRQIPLRFAAATLRDAEKVAPRISEAAARTSALFDLARAWIAAGDGDSAARAFRAALRTAAEIRDSEMRGRLLANHAGVIGLLPAALRPELRRMLARRAESVPADCAFLPRIAEAQAGDDLRGAWNSVRRVADDANGYYASLNIARARAQRGDASGAIATIMQANPPRSEVRPAQERANALAALAQDQFRTGGDPVGGARLLDAIRPLMPELLSQSGGFAAETLSFIAEAQFAGGRRADSREARAATLRAAKGKTPSDYDALGRILPLAFWQGDTAQALTALEALRSAANAAPLLATVFRTTLSARSAAPTPELTERLLAAVRHVAATLGDDAPVLTAEILERSGRIAEAATEATKIADGEKGATLLVRLAEKRIEAGDALGARPTLDAAAAAAERIPAERQRGPFRERVARLRARSGDIASAVTGAKAIPDPRSQAGAYGDILFEQLTATDYTGAQRTALGIADGALRDRMLVNIAAWQVKATNKGFRYRYVDEDYPIWVAGDKPRRADIPAAQQTAGLIADPSYRSAALSLIAQTQLALNNREGAFRTAQLIPDEAAKAGTLAALAFSREASGDRIGAEETLRQIPTDEGKATFLIERAARRTVAGDSAGARADYAAAERIAGNWPEERLAPLMASAGKMTLALDTSRRYFERTGDREIFLNVWEAYLVRPRLSGEPLLAADILARKDYPRDETLRRSVEWAAHHGNFVLAEAVAAQINDAAHRLSAYLTLSRENRASGLASLGKARVAALRLPEPEPRFRALLSVAEGAWFRR